MTDKATLSTLNLIYGTRAFGASTLIMPTLPTRSTLNFFADAKIKCWGPRRLGYASSAIMTDEATRSTFVGRRVLACDHLGKVVGGVGGGVGLGVLGGLSIHSSY